MINVELTQVRIPTEHHWNSERDEAYTDDVLGECDFDEVLMRCFDSFRDMAAALRQALAYFGENIEHRPDVKTPELIDRVEKQIRARAPSQAYLERFVGHLAVCRFVNDEFNRVLGIYVANRDLKWMAPLVDLGDWIVSATSWLEEGLVCEHRDFDRSKTTTRAPRLAPN